MSTSNTAPLDSTPLSDMGYQLSSIQSANAIPSGTPPNGWYLVSPYGEFPSPDRRYVQVFQRPEADEIVRSWNSMVGKAFRYVKNVRHKLKFRDTAPVFDCNDLQEHPDTDPENWGAFQELARVRDLRSANAGLEALIEWDEAGMAKRTTGKLFPSIQWWHNPPNAAGQVFPGHFESITLTRTPNITSVPAWTPNKSNTPNPMNEEQLKALRKSLNLPETSSVEKVLETAQSAYQLTTSNATALQTANSAKAELETKLNTANTELATANGKVTALEGEKATLTSTLSLLTTANNALVDGVVDLFELAGKITPAQRDETKTKVTANAAATITELKAKKPEMNTKSIELNGTRLDISTANARSATVQTLVQKKMKEDGCEYNDAYARVSQDPQYKQLFEAMDDPSKAKAA